MPTSAHISAFLSKWVVDAQVAPAAAAGVSAYAGDRWTTQVGATWPGGEEAPFDLASLSKPFLATLCATLVGQGRLTWTTRLERALPELKGTLGGSATIEAHLSHRAGLSAHREFFRASWAGGPIVRRDALWEAANARRESSNPSALYSDLGYLLVGAALERAFSLDLDWLLAQEVFQPRGLRVGSARAFHSHCSDFLSKVVPTEIQPPRGGLLRGVVHDDNAWALAGSASAGHAGLFGNLTSILRFGRQILDHVEGRDGAERQSQFLPLIGPREGGTLRMGFDGVTQPGSLAGSRATEHTFGHLGFTGTSLWIDPGQQKVTVLLCNRVYPNRLSPGLGALRPKIHDFLWRY